MHFTLISTVLVAVAVASGAATGATTRSATTIATLYDAPTGGIEAEANFAPTAANAIYACDGGSFTGLCQYMGYTAVGVCYDLPVWFERVISSVQITGVGYRCFMYTGSGCEKELYGPLSYGRIPQVPARFDNAITSYRCIQP